MIHADSTSNSQQPRDKGFWWMVLLSAAAFAAAFWASWQRPVWHDELYTLALARMPVAELIEALRMDSGPPLHYLICHLLYLLVGWQEGSTLGTFIVRLPSVLAFAALPWVVWRARPVATRAGLLGPLLTVTWLPMFYFATEARAYALLGLVNAVLWILGPAWIARGRGPTLCFAVLAACLPLLHYTGLASLGILPTLVFFIARQHRRRLVLALLGAVLPALAWAPVMLGAPAGSMGWVDTSAGPGRPGLSTLTVLAPAGPYPALFEVQSTPVPQWASLLVLAGVIGCAVAGGLRLHRRGHDINGDRRLVRVLAIALLPAVSLGILARLGIPVYFAGRTESMVWGLSAALVALLVSRLPPSVRWMGIGTYCVIGAATIGLWLADLPTRPPAPGVVVGQRLAPMLEEGDRVVVVGLWQLEVGHGLAAAGHRRVHVDVETLPRSQAEHPGWLDQESLTLPRLLDDALALERESRLRGSRIWLIWSTTLPMERQVLLVYNGWRRSSFIGGGIIAVDLLEPPRPFPRH